MSDRFDYVKYDEVAVAHSNEIRGEFEKVEKACHLLAEGRAKSLMLTKLEESYMWVGKAIRDDQKARHATEKAMAKDPAAEPTS